MAKLQRAEQKHREEEELHLAPVVYQSLSEAIMVVDSNNIIIAINPAFTQLTGYTKTEAIGQPARWMDLEQHDESFYLAMKNTLDLIGKWEGEICNRRKNGEYYYEQLRINTIYDLEGAVQWRVAIFSDITPQKIATETIKRHANYDLITGLPNRRLLLDRLQQEAKTSHRTGLKFALMFLDVDHFKDINDTLGHEMGDNLLKEAAHRLEASIRAVDTVARSGGDEFNIIVGELSDLASVDRIANCILKVMKEPFKLGTDLGYVSVSIGIAIFPDDASNAEELMKKADQAMYVAKKQGRNCRRYFTPSMQENAQKKLNMIRELHIALEEKQFRIEYQPIVELMTGNIRKAEALLRWQHPHNGLIAPADFLPISEETGIIIDIDNWVFQQAAEQVEKWRKLYSRDFQISVNQSRVQFKNTEHTSWLYHLDTMGLDPGSIAVEVTEGILMDCQEENIRRFLAFREKGIEVALDDFGTGYSPLSFLNKFNINYLKIDDSFVSELAPNANSVALCEAIILMAHKLGIKVIAEGVETAQQRDLLLAARCDYGQGRLFYKPIPATEFEKLLRKS